jgi:hypothetical protein
VDDLLVRGTAAISASRYRRAAVGRRRTPPPCGGCSNGKSEKYKEDGRSSALVLASIALAFQQERSGAHLVETPSDEP